MSVTILVLFIDGYDFYRKEKNWYRFHTNCNYYYLSSSNDEIIHLSKLCFKEFDTSYWIGYNSSEDGQTIQEFTFNSNKDDLEYQKEVDIDLANVHIKDIEIIFNFLDKFKENKIFYLEIEFNNFKHYS